MGGIFSFKFLAICLVYLRLFTMLEGQHLFLLCLICIVFAAFAKEWLSAELVAIGALISCVFAGILVMDSDLSVSNNVLKVFANPAPITVACMFILSAALETTGVINSLGSWFERVAGSSATKMLVVMILIVAILSGFVNNTPVVVVFMPILIAICRKKDYKASKFLIPLSYAAIAGGTMTLIGTSTNLVVVGMYAEMAKKHDFANELTNMFAIMPLGLVFVTITFIYLLTFGRKLLPNRVTLASVIDSEENKEFITHAFVQSDSTLVGQKFIDSPLKKMKKVRVIEVNRDGRRLQEALPDVVFKAGDEILFKGDLEALFDMSKQDGINVRGEENLGLEGIRKESAVLMEGIIGPTSTLKNKTLKELNFRQRFGVLVLAIHRKGANLQERFEDEELCFGDTLLAQGPIDKMNRLSDEGYFINLSQPKHRVSRRKKAPLAIGAIVAFIFIGALGGHFGIPKIPVVQMAMAGSLFVLMTRCIETQEAYEAIEWKVVFMIFGMLGLGLAMQTSGLAEIIAASVTGITQHPYILLAAIYLLSAVLTEIISNNAVAALLTPLAVSIAIPLNVSPLPFVIAVMFGSSASFSTPIGYQTNTFVYGAGGYKFSDFFRAGFPLAVIMWIVASLLIPQIWKF